MQVCERIAAALPNQEKVHQLAVVWDQRRIIAGLESLSPDFKSQNPLSLGCLHLRVQVGPRTFAKVLTKSSFLDLPPVPASEECAGHNQHRRHRGDDSFSALQLSGRLPWCKARFPSSGLTRHREDWLPAWKLEAGE